MKTKNTQRGFQIIVAVLLIILLAVIAVIKLTNRDIYGVNATIFQTARRILYAVGAFCAVAGLFAFIRAKSSLAYGLLALACLCMVFVQACSLAGEFENQGKTLQDAMYAVVFLMLAATMYIMCAMESPKKIFRVIIIVFSLILFIAAMVTDFGYLMDKAGRITSETESIVSFALKFDKIAVLLVGIAAVIYEIAAYISYRKQKKAEVIKEGA